jgi:secretion/DNA translocation related CpaE-like protein
MAVGVGAVGHVGDPAGMPMAYTHPAADALRAAPDPADLTGSPPEAAPARTLLVTADPGLHDDMLRLAAAAGATVESVAGPSALRAWSGAAAVFVGDDQAALLAGLGPDRRERVYVVVRGAADETVLWAAVRLGAASVVELPAADDWVVGVLSDVHDGGGLDAALIGVVGGSGGVGATTFACALGLTAARHGPAMLLDLDPLGPGVARVVGLDGTDGVTWEQLGGSLGRLGSRALRDALPSRHGLGVLTWPGGPAVPPDPGLVREVVTAGRRGHQVVVADLPRHLDPAAAVVAARCDRVLVVAGAGLAAVASAARVSAALGAVSERLALVVRRDDRALAPEQVADALGLPLLDELARHRRLDEQLDLGLGPVHSRRGALTTTARRVVATLAARQDAAA